jgi:hypothetical protein
MVPDVELPGVVLELDPPRLQLPAVVVAEDGHEDEVPELRLGRVPVHVEERGEGAGGPFRRTSSHHRFSGPLMAMWFGTMSRTWPSPAASSARQKRSWPSSPPSSRFTRDGSTTSYPWVLPGAAWR